jgi:hypothetical protein
MIIDIKGDPMYIPLSGMTSDLLMSASAMIRHVIRKNPVTRILAVHAESFIYPLQNIKNSVSC